ncbi:hypothetical protein V6C53_19040 [Desulfocurvibacter africanus]|uniref:hypothetical protein n=1 Tax=Desulfocurvibacter africanus TaxID=873 RepID=UPI002FD8E607
MERIKGIFSTQGMEGTSTGSTTRQVIRKQYWSALELDGEIIEVQPLNANYVPSGPKKHVAKSQFLEQFNAEPEFYVSTVLPRMRELEKTLRRGETHRQGGEAYSAEFEFNSALKVDEENVRATFGLGLTYMDRGDTLKAEDILRRLVNLEAAFDSRHKHLFNEFGINLRKNHMFGQALEYYERAQELSDSDDHLLVNIARLHFERGDIRKCILHLKEALELNPEQDEARQFWSFLQRRGQLDGPLQDMDLNKELARLKAERKQRIESKRQNRKQNTSDEDLSVKVYKPDFP